MNKDYTDNKDHKGSNYSIQSNINIKKMQYRRGARSCAFQVLYGLHFSPAKDERELSNAFFQSPDIRDAIEKEGLGDNKRGFAWELVKGVWEQEKNIDCVIASLSQNWKLDRIGRIELTLLRIALYEMMYRKDVPVKVTINEAVELSKQFGDVNAPGFINGILDAAYKAIEKGTISIISVCYMFFLTSTIL